MRPPLLARFSIACTGPSPLQTELALVFTSPTQFRTPITAAATATATTLLSIAPASSSSLQAELFLVLTCPAQAPAILCIARGWTNLRQRITDYPEVVAKYFADLTPMEIVARVDFGIEATRAEGAETRALIQQSQTAIVAMLERGNLSDRLYTRIVDAVRLIEEGAVNAGLKALERLWSNESSGATPRNCYLIKANIGLARLTLGDTSGAIPELRAAAAEDPAWPNARAILAQTELLEGNRKRAFEFLRLSE